ncbi:MAG: hypothetical protein EWV58_08990 [Microcystis aeruginosa Ma_MB_F_20061100_S19]|nr:MAG: hypothetical protein EWV59_17545 [Microcystis aeruginosa Ma_MB_F_20061100_S19D]TRU15854.1 MAG: hypothetical protein EWV58_08990 [Microcystis aeruginosa Ma_MB_F_20061100_S19]
MHDYLFSYQYSGGASHFGKSTNLGFLRGNFLLKLGITFGFITQSKLLGGSTPQTPRWGRAVSFSHQNIKSKSDHYQVK